MTRSARCTLRLEFEPLAGRMGLQRGFALHLTVVDPDDGKPWDFDIAAKRAKALRKVQVEKPTLPIGSPMCTAFSNLQKLSCERRDPVEFKKMLHYGITHLKFCIVLYWEQTNNGRYRRHVSSWSIVARRRRRWTCRRRSSRSTAAAARRRPRRRSTRAWPRRPRASRPPSRR